MKIVKKKRRKEERRKWDSLFSEVEMLIGAQ
jgi:hypothetical protein